MKSEFRSTRREDAPAVAQFLDRIFGTGPGLPLTDPRHLEWKNWEVRPDWADSRGFIVTKADAITAHGTVVPLSYVNGIQRLNMIHVIDWAADPNSVGSGVILMKRLAGMADGVVAVGGSEMTEKVLPTIGFRPYGTVTRLARPLRPLGRLFRTKLNARDGARVARALAWNLSAPSVSTGRWTVTPIPPDRLASAGVPWPESRQGIGIFERTAEIVSYFLRCPAAPVEICSVADGGTVRGYFVLVYAPGQARLADFFIDSDEPADWRTLVQLAVGRARENREMAEIVSMACDDITRQALLDCGFHSRGDCTLRIHTAKGVDLPEAPLRFQMIDSDLAYLHSNVPDYWA